MASTTWRLGFASSQGGSYVQLTEVAFLDAGGTDLSVGGVASASSEYSASYTAAKAFDKSASTDWCTVAGNFPAWLQYQHGAPVDVAQVRIVCAANSAWLPPDVSSLTVYSGGSQETRHTLSLVSGAFTGGATVILGVAAYVPPTIIPISLAPHGLIQCVPGAQYSGVLPLPLPNRLQQDYRQNTPTTGRIVDYMMLKASPTAPEVPFVRGRVWLLRALDGYKAWEGWTDAAGRYSADGLELGVAYIPVGIDPTGTHKASAAGPAVATLTGERPPAP